jgi:hypothetical protein
VLSTALYAGIVAATVIIMDLVMIAADIFRPAYQYGDPEVGWVAGRPAGHMYQDRCRDHSAGRSVLYTRNEDGVRTSYPARQLREDSTAFKIGVTGDSHTDLCASNAETHFGVLERALRDQGRMALVFADGAGRYSPLQAYLAIRKQLREYAADVLVLNVYTGNDFYDMLRVDDRPHFVPSGSGYEIAGPVWYQLDSPDGPSRSRVLFAFRTVAKKTGVRQLWLRLGFLRQLAAAQGSGFSTVLAYLNDLRKSLAPELGYRAALSAQMLNQQLFFHRFPASRNESVRRVSALMELVRLENPGRTLVLSPIPSYQLVGEQPVDDVLLRTINRLPVTYAGGVTEEGELHATLRDLATKADWLFVDVLQALRSYSGPARLYNEFDYHLTPVASDLIGHAQAEVIESHLGSVGTR